VKTDTDPLLVIVYYLLVGLACSWLLGVVAP
jgi:hypothetical protein